MRSLLIVNEQFSGKRNEEGGHYGQTLLKQAFKSDKAIEKAFIKLPFYKQKEFVEHIDTAKREETWLARGTNKIIPMILKGIGLNDKYKKC